HGVEDEVVHASAVLGRHRLVRIERAGNIRAAAASAIDPRHLASDLAGIVRGIEGGDGSRAGLAGEDLLPAELGALPQRGDQADSSDDDTTHARSSNESRRGQGSKPKRRGGQKLKRISALLKRPGAPG